MNNLFLKCFSVTMFSDQLEMFRKIIFLLLLIAVIIAMSACKKDNYKNPSVASLTLVNTVAGGKTVKLGSRSITIANYNSAQLALNEGEEDLYVWPVGDSLKPYYIHSKFATENRGVYSLFLGGTEASISGIVIKENMPYRTDSTGGIRFINLSPNSPLLNINLVSTPSVNEVTNFAYNQYTEFRNYPALANTAPYGFQIKDATNGTVLFTYMFSTANPIPRFASITLVIRGVVGSTSGPLAFGVTRVTQER